MTVSLLLLMGAELHYTLKEQESAQRSILIATKGVMAFEYGVLLLAFVPLFVGFIRMLKHSFTQVYEKMKVRSSVAFTAFMIVLLFRYAAYVLIQFTTVEWAYVETLRGEIPLYISEIIIALSYLKIIVSLYEQQKKKDE
mmetsp:Transcript_7494/g.10629  ORF Transcript_7494/g.10629 Transcript_7494/m.10629 type:complete len:140 (-) Transcript_7494:1351-1770(-)